MSTTHTSDWTGYRFRLVAGAGAGGIAEVIGPVPGAWLIRRPDGATYVLSTRVLATIANAPDRQPGYTPAPTTPQAVAAWAARQAIYAGQRARQRERTPRRRPVLAR